MKDNNYNNVMDAINGSIKYLLRNGNIRWLYKREFYGV